MQREISPLQLKSQKDLWRDLVHDQSKLRQGILDNLHTFICSRFIRSNNVFDMELIAELGDTILKRLFRKYYSLILKGIYLNVISL